MKRETILLFIILFLLAPFVFAENGCCGETFSGESCRYTVEENCATEDYFETGLCEDISWCGSGCCVSSDGGCAEGAGEYSCALAEGEFFSEQECSSVSSCDDVCCQLNSDYSYISEGACAIAAEESGIEAVTHDVASESACYALEKEEESGCCVTEDGCSRSSGAECGITEFDASTGYGFYANDACSGVSEYLENGGFVAAEDCQCETGEDYYTCSFDQKSVLASDSCGSEGDVVEVCDSVSVCSVQSGSAACVPSSCENTFAFPLENTFAGFNDYRVYFTDITGVTEQRDFQLGDKRKNGESWCIYESPVGSFRDREGTQHYRGMCVNGIELIEPCGADRSSVCSAGYNSVEGRFEADCYENNFASFYGVDYSGVLSPYYEKVLDETSILSPIEDDKEPYLYGASTVPLEGDDYCGLASFDCELVYGDDDPSDADSNDAVGWELYTNAYCLRKTFSLIAADYCSSRGSCGLKQNILGKEGEFTGFEITKEQNFANIDEIGCGKDCFAQEGEEGGSWTADRLQCMDGDEACTFYGVSTFDQGEQQYYQILDASLSDGTISPSFLKKDYMAPLWLSQDADAKEKLLDSSAAVYSPCTSPSQRLASLLKGLGTNLAVEDWFIVYQSNPDVNVPGSANTIYIRTLCEDACVENVLDQMPSYGCPSEYGDFTYSEGWTVECKGYYTDLRNDCFDHCSSTESTVLYDESYNAFRSIKPWVLNYNSLHPYSAGYLGSDLDFQIYGNYLTHNDGDGDPCGGDSNEWYVVQNNDQNSENEGVKKRSVNFSCGAWGAPLGGEDCKLCDMPLSDGGLVFDKDGVLYEASYCNPFRCESLGSDCLFIDGNMGGSQATCVSQACTSSALEYDVYEQVLEESELDYTSSDTSLGYSVDDISVKESFSFGLETSDYAQCLFVEETALHSFLEGYGIGYSEIFLPNSPFEDAASFYDAVAGVGVRTPAFGADYCATSEDPDCVAGSSLYHNFTKAIWEGERTEKYYVWCKDVCGGVLERDYQITLSSAFAAPDDPPTFKDISPASGSQVASDSLSQAVTYYIDRESQCKYSSNEGESYEQMTNKGNCLAPSGEDQIGYYSCDFSIPLQDGTTTMYFLCQDSYGNTQTEAIQWYVSKSEALEITQSSPSGTLYTNDVVLQVYTGGGADNKGSSVCSYGENGRSSGRMSLTGGGYHEQKLIKEKGNYIFAISCVDSIGNTVLSEIAFTVDKDESAAEIESVYYLGNTLYVITNEASSCQWNTEAFSYGGGSAMGGTASTDHSLSITDISQGYTIVCIDAYGNEMEPFIVDFGYFL
ncbi:MAG: hypothetical protein QT08_C0009G0060 [archaeon GW2011_AR17]|nr:MAG: hypothetical protein QT08_C0009G0060 [archaeon GW2011_AR17]MBS3154149.1 hypothetical protein [Candidatus Woesearchaeota archaeon]HIH14813.1 hypothetical protein [Nanoarchaeota archaeon]HIH59035.1 hypothetical protein [Nanoarchaeota archaeon]HIJ04954.1 hypothetical protein [Nanoarchaeota archaeon]